METTVVNDMQSPLRDENQLSELKSASEQLERVLRNEPRNRAGHDQISNCFKAYSQFLQANTLEEVKPFNFDMLKEAIAFIDSNLALVQTTADIHTKIREIISLLEKDLSNVVSKVAKA